VNSWLGTVWLIAARELRQGARAKSFRIVTVLLVAAVAAAILIPAAMHSKPSTKKVGVVGTGSAAVLTVRTAGRIAGTAVQAVAFASLVEAEAALRDGKLAAVLVPGREVLIPRTPYAGVPTSGSSLEGALALAGGLLGSGGTAVAPTPSPSLPIRGLAPPLTGLNVRLTGLAVSIVIYMIIVIYGVRITIGVSEEKSSRVVEVLLAAVRPSQLLLGKVLGMGLLALAQALAIVLTFVVLGAAVGSSLIQSASLEVVAVGAVWIVIGYAFYCTAYAAAGSLVTKPSDASNASAPVQLPLIASYLLTFTVLYGDSVYGFYWFLAYFPPTAPVSMTVLVAVGVAQPWQVALSMLICVASTAAMAWVAARIYGHAILHTGSRLKWRQAWRREA
jgi:ABC-2 type transport system permease protein